ncbi:ubiquitin-associated and SH3 domain-containing protein B-like [Lytechinus variegatus]|uniref:ubiquitin-associated and SH3 domain-containing protein B-like n=1 Tax=Lytechinus variegatus TaxID=7654 RepID=UPI001BB2A875|nr:ubiquitin-associated and SH3 domain-containing protein B-like [Lytechinus variegatus]
MSVGSSSEVHRRTMRKTSMIRQSITPLDLLMSMGFPKHRVEKAAAATGHQDIQLASDWLLNHLDDPTLDESIPREYIVYACAVGPLGEQLDEFWNKSLSLCGRNGAHSLLPHVTLCSFITCPDSKCTALTEAFQEVIDRWQSKAPEVLTLDFYSSTNFIGLFLEESHAEYLRKVMADFSQEATSKTGVKVEPHKKQLHLTLAYQFNPSHQEALVNLSKEVDIHSAARWEFRLYSRDPRAASTEVLRVLYGHTPRVADELELIPDDFIYMSASELDKNSDGWFKGTSHKTGCEGMFPGNYTEKAPESDTWTVHRVLPITRPRTASNDAKKGSLDRKVPSPPIPIGSDLEHSGNYKSAEGLLQNPQDHSYENLLKLKKMNDVPVPTKKQPRRLFIIRHGERVDVTFGEQWLIHCFDQQGKYQRKNLNMPKKVPQRPGGAQDFKKDSPITEMGVYQARMTGEALKAAGVKISYCYSSPALRCSQTAHAVLQGLEAPDAVKICVDTALFEWLAWCKGGLPKWLSPAELATFGLNIDLSYKEKLAASDLNQKENCQAYYKRSENFVREVLKECSDDGDILLVGHASTLDSSSRCLQGLSARPAMEFSRIVQKVPYCGIIMLEEYAEFSIWDLVAPIIPTLTHAPNGRFDWRIMQS